MKVFEQEVIVPGWLKSSSPIAGLQKAVAEACGKKAAPIRVAMVGKNRLGQLLMRLRDQLRAAGV